METKENKNQKPKKDTQALAYLMTCNNPLEKGYTHEEIIKRLHTIPRIDYFCLCDEIGLETKTPHTHVYFHTKQQGVRHSTLRNKFPNFDIRATQGNSTENRDYVRKEGAYLNSEKKETNLIETFEEWGELPVSHQGKRTDLERLYQLVKDGLRDSEIIELCGDTAIKHIDKIAKLRLTFLTDKYKSHRRLNLKVVYISGATGTGKTRGVLDTHGDSEVYRVSDYQHPFDSYNCEPVIAFDEFRSSLKLQDMLNYLDIYPIQLPARYSNRYACYDFLYIISNWTLEEQYSDVQKSNPESWKAFLRRIHEVRIYSEDGTITTYDSVDKYLKRDEQFHPVTEPIPFEAEQTKLPFEE